MNPRLVAVGRISGMHGSGGALKIRRLTDFEDNLREGRPVFVAGPRPFWSSLYRVVQRDPQGLVVELEGVSEMAQAKALLGSVLQVPETDLVEPPEGSFYVYALLGFRVIDMTGEDLGVLKDILSGPANDVLVVETSSGGELLLPMIKDVVREIDQELGIITVSPWPGMGE